MPPSPTILAAIAQRTINGVVLCDAQRQITWVNQGFTRITGYTAEEALGRRPGELLQGPGTDPAAVARIRAALTAGVPVVEEVLNYRKDGTAYGNHLEILPLHDDHGALTGFLALQRDVDQERQGNVLGKVADQVGGMVYQYLLRSDGTSCFPFTTAGVRTIYGFSPEEMAISAQPVIDRLHPDDRDRVMASIAASERDLIPWVCEYRYRHPAGHELWLAGQSLPERLADGATRWHGFIADITQRKRMEVQLREARDQAEASVRTKAAFLATMSHEIRTPMNGILGMLDLLRSGLEPGEYREFAELAHRSGQHLMQVLNDILDHARLEAGRLALERQPFDLAATILAALELFRLQADQAGLALRAEIPAGPWPLVGDALRVRQVIANLVGNAVKFTRAGQITVRLERGAGTVAIHVQDTGIGMSPPVLARLFTPFVQGDDGFTRRYGGSGLGLAIARELTELMGGDLRAVSTEGQGSTFTLTLPAGGSAKVADAPAGPSLRVLVVEDEPTNRLLVREMLARHGHRPVLVADGREALERLKQGGLDVVLMDLLMPTMDGLEATRRWREHERTHGLPHLPILALTACALAADRSACLEAGMDAFLTKPIQWERLAAALADSQG